MQQLFCHWESIKFYSWRNMFYSTSTDRLSFSCILTRIDQLIIILETSEFQTYQYNNVNIRCPFKDTLLLVFSG